MAGEDIEGTLKSEIGSPLFVLPVLLFPQTIRLSPREKSSPVSACSVSVEPVIYDP